MRRTSAATLFALGIGFLGCPLITPRDPLPTDTNLCGSACDHLIALGCEEGKPVYDSDRPGPKGTPNLSCTEFCTQQQNAGVAWNPRCLMQVPTCGDIEVWRAKTVDAKGNCTP